MSEESDRDDQRLEAMLRRWGADEAARGTGARLGPAPMGASAGRGGRMRLIRWIPAGIAAALLLAAAGLFIASRTADVTTTYRRSPSPPTATAAAGDDVAVLKVRLQGTTAELEQVKESLLQSDALRITAAASHQRQLAKLRRDLAAHRAELDEVRAKATALAGTMEKTRADLKTARRDLAGARASREAVEKELLDSRRRLAAMVKASGTADRQRRQAAARAETAEAALKRARGDLETLLARREVTLTDLQQIYLAAAGDGGVDLPARQAASENRQMLRRCAELRGGLADDSTGLLLDRIEVALTRLEMLDAGAPRQAAAFAAMVRSIAPGRGIEQALAAGAAAPALRAWLLEARMILHGADNVG